MWTHQSISAWPNALPVGLGGSWEGWSEEPNPASPWSAELRSLVSDALVRQYQDSELELPSSWHQLNLQGCRCVTVGHQLVLGGGPAFFHHKILSAIRVARLLEQECQIPVVPVFWMASEDHDWKEIASVEGETARHRWAPDESEVPHPVGRRKIDGIGDVMASWISDVNLDASLKEMMEDWEACMKSGERLNGLMRRWIHRWYGSQGLLILDPDDEELKKSASELWAAEFVDDGVHAALQNTEAISGPAHVRLNNVFWLDDKSGRIGVVRDADTSEWKAGNRIIARGDEDWHAWAKRNASACSPGVLLRPLYQEHLLQSLAVILGPGEWRYWQQLPNAFTHHGLKFPALRLRDHGAVHSAETRAVGWELNDGWMHEEAWDRWVLDGWLEEHQTALQSQRSALDTWHQKHQAWAVQLSQEMKGPAKALESATSKAWEQWLAKLRRSLKGLRSKSWAEARTAHAFLIRRGVPQDRWANWHVLSGLNVKDWCSAWLDESAGLGARVWCFVPSNGSHKDKSANSSD